MTDAEKQEQIEAAWMQHLVRPGAVRQRWLLQRLAEGGDACHYCAAPISIGGANGKARATLDHVIPRAKGGEDCYENVVAACLLCNVAKGDLMPDQVADLLPRRRAELLESRDKRLAWRPDRRFPY